MAAEHSRLHVIAFAQFTFERVAFAADQRFGAFLFAELDIRKNFFQLLLRGLRARIIVLVSSGCPCVIAATRLSARSMKRS